MAQGAGHQRIRAISTNFSRGGPTRFVNSELKSERRDVSMSECKLPEVCRKSYAPATELTGATSLKDKHEDGLSKTIAESELIEIFACVFLEMTPDQKRRVLESGQQAA